MAIALLVAIGLATAIAASVVLTSTWKVSGDQLAVLADVFAAGAFVLALFAGIVATFAYQVSIEQPDLWVVLRIQYSDNNRPVLVTDPSQKVGDDALVIVNNGQNNWQVQLENKSAYTGRNPVVRMEFMNLWNVQNQSGRWPSVTPITAGAKAALRWSGGTDESIHGNDVADLPILNLMSLFGGREGDHRLVIYVLAEGFRRVQEMTVRMPTPSEWCKGHPERVQLLPDGLKPYAENNVAPSLPSTP